MTLPLTDRAVVHAVAKFPMPSYRRRRRSAQHAMRSPGRFYGNMFAAHPELLGFSIRETRPLASRVGALAGSVVAYAVQLIDPNAPSFAHVMRRIAYKHMSLGVRPSGTSWSAITCSRRWHRSSACGHSRGGGGVGGGLLAVCRSADQ